MVQVSLGHQLARGPVDGEGSRVAFRAAVLIGQRVGQYVIAVFIGGRHRGANVCARFGVLRHLPRRTLNIFRDKVKVGGERGGVVAAPGSLHHVVRLHHGALAGALGVGVAHRRPQIVVDVAPACGVGRRVVSSLLGAVDVGVGAVLAPRLGPLPTDVGRGTVGVGQARGEGNRGPGLPRREGHRAIFVYVGDLDHHFLDAGLAGAVHGLDRDLVRPVAGSSCGTACAYNVRRHLIVGGLGKPQHAALNREGASVGACQRPGVDVRPLRVHRRVRRYRIRPVLSVLNEAVGVLRLEDPSGQQQPEAEGRGCEQRQQGECGTSADEKGRRDGPAGTVGGGGGGDPSP